MIYYSPLERTRGLETGVARAAADGRRHLVPEDIQQGANRNGSTKASTKTKLGFI